MRKKLKELRPASFKIEENILNRFTYLCGQLDKNRTALVSRFMREYIEVAEAELGNSVILFKYIPQGEWFSARDKYFRWDCTEESVYIESIEVWKEEKVVIKKKNSIHDRRYADKLVSLEGELLNNSNLIDKVKNEYDSECYLADIICKYGSVIEKKSYSSSSDLKKILTSKEFGGSAAKVFTD